MQCQPSKLLKHQRKADESGAKLRLFMAVGKLLYRGRWYFEYGGSGYVKREKENFWL